MVLLYPISNDGAAFPTLSTGAFPLQFTTGTVRIQPKALGEVTVLDCSPGCSGLEPDG